MRRRPPVASDVLAALDVGDAEAGGGARAQRGKGGRVVRVGAFGIGRGRRSRGSFSVVVAFIAVVAAVVVLAALSLPLPVAASFLSFASFRLNPRRAQVHHQHRVRQPGVPPFVQNDGVGEFPPPRRFHDRREPRAADPLVEGRVGDHFQQIGDEAERGRFRFMGGRDEDFRSRSSREVGRKLVRRRGKQKILVGGVEHCYVFFPCRLERLRDLPLGATVVAGGLGGGDGGLAGAAELGLVDLMMRAFFLEKESGLRMEKVDEQRASRRRNGQSFFLSLSVSLLYLPFACA